LLVPAKEVLESSPRRVIHFTKLGRCIKWVNEISYVSRSSV